MHLTEFSVAGFQSYREEQPVRIEPHVTLLAGRNNVGKSALLRALQLFENQQEGIEDGVAMSYTWRAATEELLPLLHPNAPDWQPIRDWFGSVEEHEIQTRFVAVSVNGQPVALHCVRLELPTLGAVAEGRPGRSMDWIQGGIEGASTATGELVQFATAHARRTVSVVPRRVEQGPRNLFRQARLLSDGRNLADVLLYLQLNRPTTTHRSLLEFMQTAFPDIDTVTVATPGEQPGGTLIGEPYVHFHDRPDPVPLRFCGTGVEQLLALAVAILGAEGPQLFLIDEPQAYLHPHAERSLQALLDQHEEHQYVIATHSHLLLRSRPLSQARLLTLVDGATRVSEVADDADVLDELGVTAADLWLADRILWVEGPTEEEIFDVLIASELTASERLTLAVKRMPEAASRFALGDRQARNAYKFCKDVTTAIAPLRIAMMFVFDRDEKRPADQERIYEASSGMARFLAVREVENLFLEPAIVHAFIAGRCADHDLAVPELDAVSRRLDEVLADTGNPKVFPAGPPQEDQDAWAVARGSEVLGVLTWDYTTAPYRKVEDGRYLAELALKHDPGRLEELRALVRELLVQAGSGG